MAEKVAFNGNFYSITSFKIIDSLAETESNSGDENEDKEDSDAQFYNKKSSFFDSISCEAQEKADG